MEVDAQYRVLVAGRFGLLFSSGDTGGIRACCGKVESGFPKTACDNNMLECAAVFVKQQHILEHDAVSLNRHHALSFCLSMIFSEPKVRVSENRYPLFGIML